MRVRELFQGTSITDRLLTLFNALLVGVNIYFVVIVGGQLGVMRTDERAWISARKIGADIEIGKPIMIELAFQNTGKTLATNVHGRFRVEVLDAADSPSLHFSDKQLTFRIEPHVIFPNAPETTLGVSPLSRIPGTETVEKVTLSQDLADKYSLQQIWFAAEGTVYYDDVFGRTHWVDLCFDTFQQLPPLPPSVIHYISSGITACAQSINTDD